MVRERARLVDPRHLVTAAAVGLVVQAAAIGAVGFAAAGDRRSLPDRFELPERHVGDEALYTSSTSWDDAGERPTFWFRYAEPAVRRDQDGRRHRVNRLHHRAWAWTGVDPLSCDRASAEDPETGIGASDGSDRVWNLAAGSARPVSVAFPCKVDRTSDEGGTYQRETKEVRYDRSHVEGRGVLCLASNALQGRTVDLSRPVPLFDRCGLAGRADRIPVSDVWIGEGGSSDPDAPPLQFDATATGRFDGREAVRLTWSRDDGRPDIHVWLADGIPYPVRIVTSLGESRFVLQLERFRRGDEPVAQEDDLRPRPAPEVELADRTRFGPDASGVDHPFPFAEAFRTARDDPQNSTLRDYLRGNPDAYVAQGEVVRMKERETWAGPGSFQGTRPRWRWDFVVTDGRDDPVGVDQVFVQIRRTTDRGRRTVDAAGVADTPHQPADYDIHYIPRNSTGYPSAEALPERLPTVASVMDRWQAYRSGPAADEDRQSWGWGFRCRRSLAWEPGDPCSRVRFGLEAGYRVEERNYTATGKRQARNETLSRLAVTGNGTTSHLHQGRWQADDNTSGLLSSSDGGPDGATGGAEVKATRLAGAGLSGIWVAPTAEQAAAVGLAAVVAGVLYWVWPVVKHGGLAALYTRLTGDEVLDHPLRRELMEEIRQAPGVHRAELVRRVDGTSGTVRHHLRKLVGAELVTSEKAWGRVCYLPAGEVHAGLGEALSALSSEGARRVLDALLDASGSTNKELADAVGLSPSTVHHHVRRFREAGLVEGRRAGRSVELHPTGLARRIPVET